jgi:hypothetical protein
MNLVRHVRRHSVHLKEMTYMAQIATKTVTAASMMKSHLLQFEQS